MSKILVAEDDKFLANAYRIKLTKAGFEVMMVGDGEEALAALNKFIPDLILLDLVMPKKDGFAALQEIKKDERLKNIPVIIASNLGQKEDIEKGLKLGAIDFIIKSDLSMDELVKKINKAIT
ncbi:response regulator [Candidatus Daviesbacteria bacterium]|nr:response regulator [Candidatus Daviesbacteria bacterium]